MKIKIFLLETHFRMIAILVFHCEQKNSFNCWEGPFPIEKGLRDKRKRVGEGSIKRHSFSTNIKEEDFYALYFHFFLR